MAIKFPTITTPRMTAGYTKNLFEAEEFQGTSKYKYQIKVAKENLGDQVDWYENGKKQTGTWKDFFDLIESYHVQAGGDPAIKNPVKDGDKLKKKKGPNKGKPSLPGFMMINLSSKKQPKQLDGRGREIKNVKLKGAWGGDTIRVTFWPGEYDDGLFTLLQQVQILKLGEAHSGAGNGGFVDTGDYGVDDDASDDTEEADDSPEAVDDDPDF